ncbi:MAG: hypothetical protein KOO63_05420 [Bacteroidales bacterium]|nr:hypothetical protein [Candidatus Latescibacterota bacterium]
MDNTAEEHSAVIQAKIADMADTIEILQDKDLMRQIKSSEKDIAQGRTIPASVIKAKYG